MTKLEQLADALLASATALPPESEGEQSLMPGADGVGDETARWCWGSWG